ESFEVIQENIDAPLQFEIVSQSISGALSVNNQGGLVVANAAVFDFETNTTISGTVQVSSGTISDSASFTISIMDVEEFVPFITTWNLTEDNTTVRLPVFEATGDVETQYDFMVDWGDGTMGDVTSFDDPDTAHTYAASGRYTITITGTLIGFSFGEIPDSKDFFTDVIQWGDLQLGNSGRHFLGCSNLMDFSAMDTPNLSELVNASNMFRDAISFNGSLSSWDVSNITNMGSMFSGAENFNGDISNWDVSNVTDMSFMFFRTSLFNSDISDWNTESLLEMRQMFDQATSFNSDLTNWDVSKVTDMSVLFRNAEAFNGDVSGWDVSSVTNTGGMFFGATAFNRDISGWDVAAVTDMGSMFTRASNFNQNISSWNVGNVTDMSFLFFETENFNSDISGWDVSSVINMSFMFSGAQSFNGDLSSWN
ncbi:MAG: BspA family leucine-rich repeat surface protein, partial [Bacteroidota bacterium]